MSDNSYKTLGQQHIVTTAYNNYSSGLLVQNPNQQMLKLNNTSTNQQLYSEMLDFMSNHEILRQTSPEYHLSQPPQSNNSLTQPVHNPFVSQQYQTQQQRQSLINASAPNWISNQAGYTSSYLDADQNLKNSATQAGRVSTDSLGDADYFNS